MVDINCSEPWLNEGDMGNGVGESSNGEIVEKSNSVVENPIREMVVGLGSIHV
jgi:hypothetical protein